MTVSLVADMTVINPFDFFVEKYAETFPFEYTRMTCSKSCGPFLETEYPGPLLADWLSVFRREVLTGKLAIVDMLVAANSRLQRDIGYIVRMEPGIQACDETLSLRRGSCRDSGWLLVQVLRHLGLAARFASGYLIQLTADVKPLDGPQGPVRDFTDLHASTEVYFRRWLDRTDRTSGLFAGEGHIPRACHCGDRCVQRRSRLYRSDCEVEFGFTHMT